MKKPLALFLAMLILFSMLYACSRTHDTEETTSAPIVTEAKPYDFEPFELSGLSENEYLPDESNRITYNEYGFISDDAGIYVYNTGSGYDELLFETTHPCALIAVCDNQLLFRDLVSSVVYRLPLSFDHSVSAQGQALFVYDGFISFVRCEENRLIFKNKSDILMLLDTKTGECSEIKLDYLAEFEPFYASGEYYSFQSMEHNYPETSDGIAFYVKYSDDYVNGDIVCSYNGKEKFVLELNKSIVIYGFIDDALYFTADFGNDNSALYRLEITSSGGIITDTKLSMVKEGQYQPVKAYDNKLIVASGEAGENAKYYALDTCTGKLYDTKFYYTADANDFSDDISISVDQAVRIAKTEMKNGKYFTMGSKPKSFELAETIHFIVEPHYTFGYGTGFVYEDYPWLVYRVFLNSPSYYAYVDINAQTGNVAYVYASLND